MTNGQFTRRQFTIAAGAGVLVAFSPLGSRSAGAQTKALVKITAAEAVETLYYLPMYTADALGFFKEQGLDVTIFNAQQRTIALRAIMTGDAFTYNGDPAEPAVGRMRGQKVKNIGSLMNRAGGALVAKKGVDKDPRKWAGKRVITGRLPHTQASLLQMVLIKSGYEKADKDGLLWKPKGGADKDAVQFTPVIAGGELSALDADLAEMAILIEPSISIALAKGYDVVTSFGDLLGEFLNTSFAVTEESIAKRPEHVQAFANAMQKACLFGHKNPDKAVEVAVKRYETQDAKVIAQAARNIIRDKAYPESLLVSKAAYEKLFNELLVLTGHEAKNYPMNELMDNRFAEKAVATVKL